MSQPAEQQGCNKNSSTKEPDIKKQEDIYEATDCLTKTDKVQIQEQIKDLPEGRRDAIQDARTTANQHPQDPRSETGASDLSPS